MTYTASVDFDNITGKGTVTQTGNTVKIKADDDPEETVPTDISNQIDYNPLGKSAGAASGDGNIKTIPWTITVNDQQLKSVAGTTITDHNNSSDVMSYSGNGITIAVMDGNRTIRTITKTWAELGVDDPASATSWSYQIPNDDDDLNNTYKYVITYDTTVDASGKIADFNVNNTVDDGDGHQGGGSGTVPPGEDKVTLEKTNTSYSAGTSDWEVSFNVPKSGLSSAVLTDRFPEKWASSHWIDTLLGDIEVQGLLEGESYSVDTSSDSQVVVTFYKSGEKTEANQGLLESESDRTITVKLTTKNTDEWVQAYSGDGHTNTASLNVNGQVITDQATSYPKSEGVTKTGSYVGTTTIEGREYPVFRYTLSLYDVSDNSFDSNKKLTITDSYNGTYLKLLVKPENGEGADWGELRWSWANGNNANQNGRTNYSDNNGTLTITADKSEFVLDGNGLYNSVYQIYYFLIVKDQDALNAIEQASISASDHKVPLGNEATWGTFKDNVTIDYEYPAVDKTQLTHADSNGLVRYKIVLNPDKLMLNGGQPMEMLDSATNITIDYSTIVIESDPQANINYYYRGYTGYYTIPDRTKVTITYSARVIGNGSVPISNEATMKGFKDSTSSTESGGSSGSGNLNIDWVLVYKHEWRQMEKGLNNAVYVLTDEEGNPILYPANAKGGLAGQPVTFTTGSLDLHALPDGTYVDNDGKPIEPADPANPTSPYPNVRDGYAWIYLSKDETGLAIQKGITYYFKEYSAPAGYQKDDTIFSFTIAEHPDYDDWEYYKGDVLRLADSKVEGNLEIQKSFVGAENLTDTQKKQITFKITGVDSNGDAIRIPYVIDRDGNYIYADESGLEISYADFENGVYKLDALPNGTYTVTETNYVLGGYTHVSTTYTVDGTTGTAEDLSGSVTITDRTKHTFAYTNTYQPEDVHITVFKKDDGQIYLYGATFQLYKKNSGGDYEAVTNHPGLTTNGEFTIDYENRTKGVTITGLEAGEYYIKETKAPAGYQLDETPFYFTVNAQNQVTEGTHGTNVTFENSGNNLIATVKDKISHTYTLTKVDAFKLSKKLNGAEFAVAEVTGFNSDNSFSTSSTNYWTKTTGEDGTFVIDADEMHLDPTKLYVIWETKAPEGYELSTKVYAFYTGDVSAITPNPALLSAGYPDASIVSLANGPQKTTVPNTQKTMDFLVKKQWYKVDGNKLADDIDAIKSIDIKLFQVQTFADGTVNTVQYPDEDTLFTMDYTYNGNWLSHYFKDLPTGDSVNTANPVTYTYYVEEVVPEGYQARYVIGTVNTLTGSEAVTEDDGTIEIRNSPKPIQYSVKKVWLDDGNGRPGEITVTLYYLDAAGNKVYPNNDVLGGMSRDQKLKEDNGWSFTWPTLDPGTPDNPKTYYVEEYNNQAPSGYTVSYQYNEDNTETVITNTKTTSDKLKVKKVWLNSDGTEMTAEEIAEQEPVIVQLQRQAGKLEGVGITINAGGSAKVSNQIVATGSDISFVLVVNQAGDTVPNVNIDHGAISEPTIEDAGWTKNYKYNCTVTEVSSDLVINITGTLGESNIGWQFDVRDLNYEPANMIIEGVLEDVSPSVVSEPRVTLSSSNNWMKDWGNLPTDAGNGNTWYYSVREVEVPAGFNVTYENNDGIQTGIMYVKNTVSDYTRATARKAWLNADGTIMTTPPEDAEVTFALYQNGKLMSKKITLDGTVDGTDEEGGEREPWVAVWEGLEKADSSGTPYVYTIKEFAGFTGYTAMKLEGSDYVVMGAADSIASGETIYNKKSRSLTVTKAWQNEQGGTLADIPGGTTVTIGLYKSGETEAVKTITLDGHVDVNGESPEWVANFTNLEDGATYIVKEEGAPSGFMLVSTQLNGNTPVTENVNAEVTLAAGDNTVVYTNKKTEPQTGSLKLKKLVSLNGGTPFTEAQSEATAADDIYTFTVVGPTSAAQVDQITKYVQIIVTNGVAVSYQIADNASFIDDAFESGTFAIVSDLPEGDYVITETAVEGMTVSSITGGNNDADTTNRTITIHVTAGDTTAAQQEDH